MKANNGFALSGMSPINTSKSKALWSFPKGKRFPKVPKP